MSPALAFLTVTTFLLCLAGGTELICSLCIVPYLVRTVLGTVLAASVTTIIVPAVLISAAIVTTAVVIAVLILAVTVIFPAVIISAVVVPASVASAVIPAILAVGSLFSAVLTLRALLRTFFCAFFRFFLLLDLL